MAFGQLHKWLEHCDIPPVQKRLYSDEEDPSKQFEKKMTISFLFV